MLILAGLTYPALAVVFGKTLSVFQIEDSSAMVKEGDFYALMFFTIALVVTVCFSVIGWFANLVSQVSQTSLCCFGFLLTHAGFHASVPTRVV